MLSDEELRKLVPSFCPFCDERDDVKWDEFLVGVTDYILVSAIGISPAKLDDAIEVTCTRCSEVIDPDDWRDDDGS
jgi:hypothetical protein